MWETEGSVFQVEGTRKQNPEAGAARRPVAEWREFRRCS